MAKRLILGLAAGAAVAGLALALDRVFFQGINRKGIRNFAGHFLYGPQYPDRW